MFNRSSNRPTKSFEGLWQFPGFGSKPVLIQVVHTMISVEFRPVSVYGASICWWRAIFFAEFPKKHFKKIVKKHTKNPKLIPNPLLIYWVISLITAPVWEALGKFDAGSFDEFPFEGETTACGDPQLLPTVNRAFGLMFQPFTLSISHIFWYRSQGAQKHSEIPMVCLGYACEGAKKMFACLFWERVLDNECQSRRDCDCEWCFGPALGNLWFHLNADASFYVWRRWWERIIMRVREVGRRIHGDPRQKRWYQSDGIL